MVIKETSGNLWQYYRDEPALTNAGSIANFHAADESALLKFKQKITGVTNSWYKKYWNNGAIKKFK